MFDRLLQVKFFFRTTVPAEREALSRFRPHTLVEAKELLPLAEFTSKHEFLHQAQRRFTTVVHNRNWRDLEQADAGPVPR